LPRSWSGSPAGDRAIEPATLTELRVRRARWSLAALFAVNGALWASVVPRLPELKAHADLSGAAYGTGIAAFSVGALGAGLAAGWLVARVGSARLTVAAAVLSGFLLAGPALATSWLPFALAVLLLGALDSAMDVAMNAHGLRVQRALGRSILHGMHAWWSIGAIIGGGIGAAAGAVRVAPTLHLAVAGLVLAAIAVYCQRHLLDGAEAAATPATAGAHEPFRVLARAAALLAALVVFAAIVEDAPGSWSGVLLTEDLGVPAGLAGSAYVAFMVTMTGARLVSDRLIDRFGPVRVVRVGAVVSTLALTLALAVNQPLAIVAGFALVGLGAAPAYPAAFQAAEHLPRVTPAAGVAAVSLAGRGGFLVAPLLIGALAEAASLRTALIVTIAASLAVVAAAGALRGRVHSPGG
jgi:fucose permease